LRSAAGRQQRFRLSGQSWLFGTRLLDGISHVGEIHLAGYSEQHDDENALLLIDSHDRAIADPVWDLYRHVVAHIGPIPTLIEWDSHLPAWPELRAQALAARRILSEHETPLVEHTGHEA
jgi:uncharacterized protein